MGHLTQQLDDVILIGNTYFECLSRLKQEEGQMILDLHADKLASPQCTGQIETMYYEHYDNTAATLKRSYDNGRVDWRSKRDVK